MHCKRCFVSITCNLPFSFGMLIGRQRLRRFRDLYSAEQSQSAFCFHESICTVSGMCNVYAGLLPYSTPMANCASLSDATFSLNLLIGNVPQRRRCCLISVKHVFVEYAETRPEYTWGRQEKKLPKAKWPAG